MTDIAAILIGTALGIWALRRYPRLPMHAEVTAHQADCPQWNALSRSA